MSDAEATATTAVRPDPGGEPRPSPVARVRSSLLLKVLCALAVALLGSSALTAFLETRLTADALASQSDRVARANLRTVAQAYDDRERSLLGALRNLGQTISAERLTEPEQRNKLIGELGRAARNLELDLLQVVNLDGTALPPEGTGEPLARPPRVTATDIAAPVSRLLVTADGRYLQTLLIPIGQGLQAPVLVGAYDFGDSFAYRVRRQLDEQAHVVLVAGGRVAGTTLPEVPPAPPGAERPGAPLPQDPMIVEIDGLDALVAYQTVTSAGAGGASGAVGVAVADPDAPLHEALGRNRLLAAVVLAALALVIGWVSFRALMRPLVRLERTARTIAGGDLDASFEAPGSDEIATLARSLERMRLELRSQLDLIADQASALQDSSKRIVAAQDEERHRLARDLHDGIQQHLVVLRMGFGLAKEAAERAPERGATARSLAELSAELDLVIERLREVSHDLYPSILIDRGLAAALRGSVSRLAVSASLRCSPDPLPRLPPDVESGAYFLIGEALANALKHAEATEIEISLVVGDGWLTAQVRDDGLGFAPDQERRGGLLHMQDRARSFGGHLGITSAPGRGTTVTATFPIRWPAEMTGSLA